jgi:uncharacterized membrane protein YidH (DUF202 family)
VSKHSRRPPGRPAVMLDAGLQPERTDLAWRRTVLALLVGGVVALRILPPALGQWGVLLGAGGTLAALLIAAAAARRSRSVAAALRQNRPLPPLGGLLATVAVMVSFGALSGLAAVTVVAAHRR